MKTICCPFLILAVMTAAGVGSPVAAQEAAPARSAGRVLLLQSDRGLEGDIEKIGDQYRVRRGSSEVWLPAAEALRLCADWQDAYAFMKTRANLGDPEERLRLARWCQLNRLRAQALIEAQAALQMRPAHQESRQLVAVLTRSVASLPNHPAKASAAQPGKTRLTPSARDISSDCFALFATRVQPILMNACVHCHSGGRGGDFQLIRTEGGQRSSTAANLAAVLAQVNVDRPAVSPLLIKAVSPHGNVATAPIKDRQTVPFTTLHGWVDHLLANNPHLKHQETETAASVPKKTSELVAFAQAPSAPPLKAKPMVISRPAPRSELPTDGATPAKLPQLSDAAPLTATTKAIAPPHSTNGNDTAPETQLNALDPFDPAIFNRQMHPRK